MNTQIMMYLVCNTEITGGFMEPTGHGQKGTGYAIFEGSPDTITTVDPGPYNIGIDYTLGKTPGRATDAIDEELGIAVK